MELRFLGSGDAFGSGGRFNTCFYVRDRKGAFLVDCGASSMIAVRKFKVDPNTVRAIFVTHLHGDHFGGLPFFILDAQLVSRRTAPLTIAGPAGLRNRLTAAMETLFPGSTELDRSFAMDIREIEPQIAHNVDDIQVTPYVVKHASGALPFAYRIEVDGKILCYSGDTEWVHTLAQAAKGADLFVAECYFYDRQVKFHLDYATLAQHLPGPVHGRGFVGPGNAVGRPSEPNVWYLRIWARTCSPALSRSSTKRPVMEWLSLSDDRIAL